MLFMSGSFSTGFRPASLPIYGTYDDYGRIENVENKEVLEAFYKDVLAKIESGEMTGTERTEDEIERGWDKEKGLSDPEDVIKCAERGYLNGKTARYGEDEEYFITIVMMHKKIFKEVVSEIGSRVPYKRKETYREELLKTFPLSREKCEDNKILWEKPEHFKYIVEPLAGLIQESIHHELDYIVRAYYEEDKFLEDIVDLKLLQHACQLGRITLEPGLGTGSQCTEYMVREVISEAAEAVVDKKWGESCDEEDDFDMDSKSKWMRETIWSPLERFEK